MPGSATCVSDVSRVPLSMMCSMVIAGGDKADGMSKRYHGDGFFETTAELGLGRLDRLKQARHSSEIKQRTTWRVSWLVYKSLGTQTS